MAIPVETDRVTRAEPAPAAGVLAAVPAPAAKKPDRETAEVAPDSAAAPATPSDPVTDTDDLVFRPHAYQGREVVVTGSVVRLLGLYRLKSESGQNSIVIDTDALSRADRAKLHAAIEKAGFLGQVRARITGRVGRQTPVTFELEASELALEGAVAGSSEPPGAELEPAFEEPPLALLDPVEPPAPTAGSSRWAEPDESGGAGAPGADLEGRGSGEVVAAPVYHQPQPAYVPTCYRDTVWRRLPDGRIQTGTRTRCY